MRDRDLYAKILGLTDPWIVSDVDLDAKAKTVVVHLARAAGAQHVVNYRAPAAADEILGLAPDGVDVVVEVAAGTNAALDTAVLAANGTVTAYATDGGIALGLSIRELMSRNIRYQFVLVYTVPPAVKDAAVADVVAAAAAGALEVGTGAGLPLLRFPLEQTAAAHSAVESGAVGKVLIDIA